MVLPELVSAPLLTTKYGVDGMSSQHSVDGNRRLAVGSPSPVHHLWLPSTLGTEHPTQTGPGLPFMHYFLVAWSHLYGSDPAVPSHLGASE